MVGLALVQTFILCSILPARCALAMEVQNLWEWLADDWSKLRSVPLEGVHVGQCLDGQTREAGKPRDLGFKKKKINEMIVNDILQYS